MVNTGLLVKFLLFTFSQSVLAFPGKLDHDNTRGHQSPCPALNTLANHGILPRNGVNISVEDMNNHLEDYFGFSLPLDIFRRKTIWKDENGRERLNLQDLWKNNDLNASYIYEDGSNIPSIELLQGLENAAGEDGILTYVELADWRDVRLEQYKRRKEERKVEATQEDEFTLVAAHAVNSANIFIGFGDDPLVGKIGINRVMEFMRENRFPQDFVPHYQREGTQSAPMRIEDPLFSSVETFFFKQAALTLPVSKPPAIHDCMSRFSNLQFDIQDYERYPYYFREDSRIVLAEAGEYVGPGSIEEYVKFADDRYSPYVQEKTGLHQQLKFKGIDNGICQFLVTLIPEVELGIGDERSKLIYGTLLHVNYDFHEDYIPDVYVHYEKDFLKFFFDDALNTVDVRSYICDVSESCANMNVNVGISHKQCVQKLKDLPIFTNGAVDGDSFGCRALHAVFAQENQDHCAHISFEPKEDLNGKIKCQTSAGYSSLDFFEEADLEDFRDFMEDYPRVESRDGIKILSQDKASTSTWRQVFFGGLIPLTLLVGSLALLPKKKEPKESSTKSNKQQARVNQLLDIKSYRLHVLICVVIVALLVFNGLASLVIWAIAANKGDEWGGTQTTFTDYYNVADRYHGERGKAEDSSLQHMMDDDQYIVYVAFVVWITVMISGLGLEVFVWYHFLQIWDQNREILWRFVQFIFPLMLMTALGLAVGHNFWSLPMIVMGLWKFGFPETLMYLYLGLFAKDHSRSTRLADFLNGIGTVIHHGAASMVVSLILIGVVPYSSVLLSSTLILVMQHWVALLSYTSKPLYIGVMLVLEYFFEWIVFSDFADIYNLHWALAQGTGVMIFAHWLYLTAGLVEMLSPSHGDGQNVHTRGNKKMVCTVDGDISKTLMPDLISKSFIIPAQNASDPDTGTPGPVPSPPNPFASQCVTESYIQAELNKRDSSASQQLASNFIEAELSSHLLNVTEDEQEEEIVFQEVEKIEAV